MEPIITQLAQELDQNPQYVANVVQLLDEGNTIPFIEIGRASGRERV